VQALKGVSKQSVIRTKQLGQPLATEDFVRCANALRAAWKLHTESEDRPKVPQLESALRQMIADQVALALQSHFVDVGDSGDILVRD